jgi:hypothetical protein
MLPWRLRNYSLPRQLGYVFVTEPLIWIAGMLYGGFLAVGLILLLSHFRIYDPALNSGLFHGLAILAIAPPAAAYFGIPWKTLHRLKVQGQKVAGTIDEKFEYFQNSYLTRRIQAHYQAEGKQFDGTYDIAGQWAGNLSVKKDSLWEKLEPRGPVDFLYLPAKPEMGFPEHFIDQRIIFNRRWCLVIVIGGGLFSAFFMILGAYGIQ